MGARIRDHVRTNVVGYIALFFALSGGAYALQGKNTVDSGDIKPKQVKRSDLAPNAVNSSKVGPDALTGADILEASLGQVPSAQSAVSAQTAQSADTAQTANSAASADTLDGLNSTDFLGKNETAANADKVDGADQCRSQVLTLVPADPDPILCEAGGLQIQAFCSLDAADDDTVAEVWVPGSSAPGFLAVDAFKANPGGGVFVALAIVQDPPAGGSSMSNALPFYFAEPNGDQIAGILGVRASATSPTAGTCDFVLSATS